MIILGTVDERLEEMERALDGGAVDYVSKPISSRRIAIRVRGAIERRRSLQELRGSFTSMLVHDLRAPLTALLAYVDILEQSATDSAEHPQGRYLARMREACAQMHQLTSEILKLSRLEAGRLVVERRSMDLAALAAAVFDRFEPAARRIGIVLELRGADRPLAVLGDASRLDQVLTNLVGNALKFTPEGGRIVITVAEIGREAEVTVADNGPGIPADEMALLFEKFRQAGLGQSSRHAGTGLGLVICRHLVEAHGGSIHAESPPGEGARFVFRLPLRQEGDVGRISQGVPCRRTRQIAVGLLLGLATATPAAAGSASAPFQVSASVISNCRGEGQTLVCTRGAAHPRTLAVVAPSRPAPRMTRDDGGRIDGAPANPAVSRESDAIVVTVNF